MSVPSVAERLRRAERYLSKMGSAAPGKGDEHAYTACKVGLGFDLAESEFWPVLAAWNNGTASPRKERELAGKLASVYRKTQKTPGWLLEGDRQRSAMDPTPPRRTIEPKYPPADEVQALWERARFANEVPEVAAWLQSRGIDHAKLGEHPALAVRALPRKLVMDPWPRWATCGEHRDGTPRPWPEAGYQAIIPLFNARGQLVSFKARWTGRAAPTGPKSLPPRGFDIFRLFMASFPAILALHDERWYDASAPELRLVEGEPDFLTTIQRIHESTQRGRGVLGIFNGSWSVEMFRRLPAGTVVIYDGHQDAAGGDYLTSMIKLIQTTGLSTSLKAKGITFKRAIR